jgi:hypothetical protein
MTLISDDETGTPHATELPDIAALKASGSKLTKLNVQSSSTAEGLNAEDPAPNAAEPKRRTNGHGDCDLVWLIHPRNFPVF